MTRGRPANERVDMRADPPPGKGMICEPPAFAPR
ncbi:hypothetical protein J3A72_001322 [Stenotrophomonas sp. PvP093]|nr:hypothetical protein [Stenotrophomonas sp. PvP093]QNG84736.1 hypothetical protein PLCFDHLH_00387 [Stenotrophomonas maltophilia]QNG89206.1 hypothetical protein IMCGPPIG_00391 [Stenotrophomonas maltophilia]TQM05071.1 hypothetical protein FB552_2742 [Stenotrophomonas maltophilia]